MSTHISGFDELRRKLETMQENVRSIHGENQVALGELMPSDFAQRYTDFDTLQAMIDAAESTGIVIGDDGAGLDSHEFSQFAAAHSQFAGWCEMKQVAAKEWAARKIGL